MVCEGSALRQLWLEVVPPKSEEEKMSWDAVRKEYIKLVGCAWYQFAKPTKQQMQCALRKKVKRSMLL